MRRVNRIKREVLQAIERLMPLFFATGVMAIIAIAAAYAKVNA